MLLPDPGDDLVLETAVNGRADTVVTFNRHHFEAAASFNVAVAEKVSALRTKEYFADRAAKGDIKKALRVLKRAGKRSPPVPGDELPRKTMRRHR